jgi:hypothetical protein
MKTKTAIDHLAAELRKDDGYFESWKANIAMAFKDEYARRYKQRRHTRQAIHEIANQAAVNFLNLLMRGEGSDLWESTFLPT